MAITFGVQGTQLDAVYARFAKSAGLTGATPATVAASASSAVFGGSFINMSDATLIKSLIYPCYTNGPATSVFAVRQRVISRYTGNPAANNVFWSMNGAGTTTPHGMELIHVAATGLLSLRYQAVTGSATNYPSAVVYNPTAGSTYDIMVSWDGTVNAGALKFSVEGVEVGSATVNVAHTTFVNQLFRPTLSIGQGISTLVSNYDLNEFTVFDTAENHIYAARSAFEALPGADELFPPPAKIENGYNYFYTNTSFVGTLSAGGGGGGSFVFVG